MLSEARIGILAVVGACTIWGLSPLFYKMVAHVPPLQVMAHRTVWSLLFFVAVLLVQGRLRQVAQALSTWRGAGVLAVASLMIGTNWFLFIWAVTVGRTTESSLGYYIYPLLAVVIGSVLFAERLGRAQWLAVALAALAVIVLTLGLGAAPWIALTLAATFGLYGTIKKQLTIGPVVSVTAEVLLLTPLAAFILLQSHHNDTSAMDTDWTTLAVLVLAGPVTAVPLILFSYAAKRVRMTTLGLVQYLNPTLQFSSAVFVFGEAFEIWHVIAFGLIWTALAIYSASAIAQDRVARKAVRAAGASSTHVT